jgi:limonene-1,2-epoxide hydrolase
MGILFLLVFALAGRPAETVAAEQGAGFVAGESCPPAHGQSETRVRNLLSSPLLPEMAARFNIGTASASDVRLLTNRGDLETCRALWNALASSGTELSAEDRVTFYRSGDTFFVPISRSRRPGTPGAIQLDGYSSLDVYDAEFRLVGRFGA